MTAAFPEPAARVEGGALGVADGLLMLIREAADRLQAGSVVAVRTAHPTAGHDLPAWCRITGHAYLGTGDGPTHYVRTGDAAPPPAGTPDWGVRAPLRPGGEFHTRDWMVGRAGDVPDHATGATGFAPRGAVVEPGSPAFDFAVNEKAAVWAAEVADLYEQATANQWDASRDIPWADLTPLPEPVERAVCQVMTFLAENEYSALYVPAKFVPRINPQFAEVVFFLCTQMADEARHIEAFTKRALANGGGLQYAAASTQLSLKTLFDQHDFTVASFLLSVLGEGTFLDLLKFVEDHAPDPVTAEVCRRARADEARHVRFGVAHVRYYLGSDPAHYEELRRAVRQRAGVMESVTEVSERVRDALAVLAAGGLDPARLGEGVRAVRAVQELVDRMHENRVKRLVQAGFTAEQAEEMSRLHTPNFM
jgi:hypothetical protein